MAGKKFKFRLQKLLKHRETIEQRQQMLLIQRRQELITEQQKLQQLYQEEQQLMADAIPKPGDTVDLDRMEQIGHWLKSIRDRQQSQANAVQVAEQKIVEQEHAVAEARKNVKVLEKLEEKQREAFIKEQLHEEQIFLDDIAGQQYIRRGTDSKRLRLRSEAQQQPEDPSEGLGTPGSTRARRHG